MGIEHEEAVRAFLEAAVTAENASWDSHQVERLLGYMSPAASYHVWAWHKPFVGRDAIREELLRQAPLFSDGTFEFLNFASAGQTVFVERRDWVTMNGKRAGFHVVGVFDFDDNGKIASWRDYFDTAELTAKVGRFEGIGASQEGVDQ
jgi:limonene-1,2-epoxide hydrolase